MKRLLFLSVCTCLSLMGGAAFAGGGNNVSKLTAEWGGGGWAVCGEHALTTANACIGATQNCGNRSMYARQHTDEWAVQMLVAMQVNENGAYFCPVQIEGKNKNKGKAWTEYAAAGQKCLWLCKPGYTGDRCAQSTSAAATSCDSSKLDAAAYSDVKRIVNGANIEDKVAMFAWNNYQKCGAHKGQEHDIILTVSRWTPSGHGAFVRQMVVRSQRSGWKDMISWAAIYPAAGAEEILTCKNGYKPNVARNDCEEITASVCAMTQLCSGWTNDAFDSATMLMVYDDAQGCYQYRCRAEGSAFESAVSRRCSTCSTTLRGGVSPRDGTCVSCDTGSIYDKNASSSGYCVPAMMLSHPDMLYGRGKTQSTNSKLANQCWPILEMDAYEKCVRNGGATSSETSN